MSDTIFTNYSVLGQTDLIKQYKPRLEMYCLSFIQQSLDAPAGSKIDLFKYQDKYGEVDQILDWIWYFIQRRW